MTLLRFIHTIVSTKLMFMNLPTQIWDRVSLGDVGDDRVAEERLVFFIQNFSIDHRHHHIKLVCKNIDSGECSMLMIQLKLHLTSLNQHMNA